jgi:hypothetical protein
MDHVADKSGIEMVRLAKQYAFPDFVKQANLEQTTAKGLPPTVYADPRPGQMQFPCHTAASTWLSTLYYTEKRAEFHPKDREQIEARLDRFSSYWRIKSSTDAIKARWQELHKTAEEQLPDSMYAYVWTGEDGTKHRRLRLKTAAEVKAASDWLHEYRDRVPFSDRHVIAKKILEKSSAYGAGLGERREFVNKQAGLGCGDPREIVSMIEGRVRLVPLDRGVTIKTGADGKEERTESLREHFLKIAQVIKEAPRKAMHPTMLVKLCETIDMLDRQQGWIGRYEHGLPRPDEVIFKVVFEKAAEDLKKVVSTTSGKVYEKSALAKIAVSDIEALFGSDFANRVTTKLGEVDPEKFAEEASALPRPDAELLDGLLSDSGVRPLLTKAASARQGFSVEEQRAWAEAYAAFK